MVCFKIEKECQNRDRGKSAAPHIVKPGTCHPVILMFQIREGKKKCGGGQ